MPKITLPIAPVGNTIVTLVIGEREVPIELRPFSIADEVWLQGTIDGKEFDGVLGGAPQMAAAFYHQLTDGSRQVFAEAVGYIGAPDDYEAAGRHICDRIPFADSTGIFDAVNIVREKSMPAAAADASAGGSGAAAGKRFALTLLPASFALNLVLLWILFAG